MMGYSAEASPLGRARIIGGVYLLYFVTAIPAQFLIGEVAVSGDTAAVAESLLAHEHLFRMGLATKLVATSLYIAVTGAVL